MYVKSKIKACGVEYICKPCHNQKSREWRASSSGKASCLAYREKRRDGLNGYFKDRYQRQKESLLGQMKSRYGSKKDDPEFREKRRKYDLEYSKRQRSKRLRCNRQNKRKALKLLATPSWANQSKIKEIYLNCPAGHHVDHIIPLKGKNVRGLHVENNLQYLPEKANLSKGNSFGFRRVSL
jgi:hypothetical protein